MKTTTLLIALLVISTSAFAQDDAAKRALAREVISAMHADKIVDGMVAQIKKMPGATVPADATAEQRAKAEKLQADTIELSTAAAKKMIEQMDQVHASVYTDGELQAMKTFFNSPEGQSMLAKQPQIVQKIMPLMQQMQQELMPKIQALAASAKELPATPPTPTPAP